MNNSFRVTLSSVPDTTEAPLTQSGVPGEGSVQVTLDRANSKVTSAMEQTSTTPKSTLIAPPDLSPAKVEEFKKKGLTYRQAPEGHYLCVYTDPETQQVSEFVYNPQAWISAHSPKDINWRKSGVTVHAIGNNTVHHFNRTGANTYSEEVLSKNNLILGDRTLTQKLTTVFRSQLYEAFGISLTSWSHPDGALIHDVIAHNAGLWLDDGYLNVNRDDSGVLDGDDDYGHSLFLQNTSPGA